MAWITLDIPELFVEFRLFKWTEVLDQIVDFIVDEVNNLIELCQTVGIIVLNQLDSSGIVYQLGR